MEIGEDILLPSRMWVELIQWRAGYHCERCERDREALKQAGLSGQLHAHHKDHDHSNNCLSNGECLCPPCHGYEHSEKKPMVGKCIHGHENEWYLDRKGSRTCRGCKREYMRKKRKAVAF